MTRRLFGILIALATLHFSGCETFWDYGSIGKVYLIYKFSPQQASDAEMQVQRYSIAVQRGKRAPVKQRYIAVQTLDPDHKQLEAYAKQRAAEKVLDDAQGRSLSPQSVGKDKLHCLMVFDTVSEQFVGSDCYVVSALPAEEQLVTLESVTAEFVGRQKAL